MVFSGSLQDRLSSPVRSVSQDILPRLLWLHFAYVVSTGLCKTVGVLQRAFPL